MLRSSENQETTLNEVKRLGGFVYIMPQFPRHFLKNYMEVKQFIKNHKEYQIMHVHANSLIYILPLFLGKKYGVKHRIMHSHSTQTYRKVYKIIHIFNRGILRFLATDLIACGKKAGEWMFKNNPCIYVHNAVDCKVFDYSIIIRNEMRLSLKVLNKKVIGHIGRLTPAKNHGYLIKIMKKLVEIDKDYIMFFVGEGELQKDIQDIIISNNLQNNIYLLGKRNDISKLLQAFDIIVFPSFHEGIPFALIEAQASGTPIIASDRIDKDVQISDLISFMSLDDSIDSWCEAIKKTELHKQSYKNTIIKMNYDIQSNANFLQKYYERMCNK